VLKPFHAGANKCSHLTKDCTHMAPGHRTLNHAGGIMPRVGADVCSDECAQRNEVWADKFDKVADDCEDEVTQL
jgi:hypothetical protein